MTAAKKNMVEENKKTVNEALEKKKKCFIMMPIADHKDYPDGHFSRVYEFLIKPACDLAGLEPYRADDNKASDMIMIDILQKLIECDMAICDISSRNANVFFELGLRQAFNKKTILITDGAQVPPFDISGLRNVSYSPSLRVDTVSVEMFKISEMLKETEKLTDDKVNSVVQLLKIRPAKVDSKELPPIDSVVFKMLAELKEQIAEINTNTASNKGLSKFNANFYNSSKNLDYLALPSGYTFDDFYHDISSGTKVLANWTFKFQRDSVIETKDIGVFIGQKGDTLIFELDGIKANIPNTLENRRKIHSI
jgi:hypothetical protein